ncbi:hypothetical protein PTTG_30347 [Puccinia triticina 1-1 BBBD Race 1]|uniref:Thiolase_C domain-containing protein n=1 Tax=Puccinia triticina (isolate 1-1 / race 1 (BBBD)) TaxID=630390 RepID=A0A180FZF5_PUCT1|nr:hypothetical protein PTTG_30347 [Puccinia triticina 1-1 BBBD Race 1]
MPRIQSHATARLFQSIYPHDPKIAAGNPTPSPSDDPHSPLRRSRPHRPLASVNGDRQTTTISAVPPSPLAPAPSLSTLASTPTSPCRPTTSATTSWAPLAIDELAKRFQPVWITQSPLSCRLSPKTEALIWMRFLDGAGRTKGALKVMIALNLHSSQQLLPVITNAILTLLRYLGAENVGLGVQHHMRCAMEETIWMGVDRIKLLSEYRNQALLAFDNADRALDGLSNLVFINDVFLCAQDILELLWQRRFQGADSACGTDWWEAKTLREQYGSQTPRRPTTPARTPAYAEAACAPIDFPIAPTLAIPMALEKAGLEFKDMTKIEINEAFPVVALASMKILGIKAEKVNVNGGAVALGHPIGSSCCWIVVSLINSLKPGEYGVAGVCNGVSRYLSSSLFFLHRLP